MASHVLLPERHEHGLLLGSRQSATEAKQTLFYVQAVGALQAYMKQEEKGAFMKNLLRVPNVAKTKRLPGIVLFHHGMRLRLTNTLQQPVAVQDVEGTVVGFEPHPADTDLQTKLLAGFPGPAEYRCRYILFAIHVELDDCQHRFLPEGEPGVLAIEPDVKTWKYYFPEQKGVYVLVRRRKFPLMLAKTVGLYSMQGTTADPGMVAYWAFPERCSDTVKWLIVYEVPISTFRHYKKSSEL